MKQHITSIASRLFGKFADTTFPKPFQCLINQSYVKLMKLNMDRFAHPCSYQSLNALFTRPLRHPPLAPNDEMLCLSCADALITHTGKVSQTQAYQIKAMSYPLDALLGSSELAQTLEGGEYLNLYLSPKDYHRYHAPCDLKVVSLRHIPGKLYPVNLPFLRKKPRLFLENERVVMECYDQNGALHVLVLVGALNVGKMVVTFEPSLQTNTPHPTQRLIRYDTPVSLQRIEEFGYFQMGSTIVHFAQKGALKLQVQTGDTLKVGDPIGTLAKAMKE